MSRVTETFKDEHKAMNEPTARRRSAICSWTARTHKVVTELGVPDKQLLAAFSILVDGTQRLLGNRLFDEESEKDWGTVIDDLRARGLGSVELIFVDGPRGWKLRLGPASPTSPSSAASCTLLATSWPRSG